MPIGCYASGCSPSVLRRKALTCVREELPASTRRALARKARYLATRAEVPSRKSTPSSR